MCLRFLQFFKASPQHSLEIQLAWYFHGYLSPNYLLIRNNIMYFVYLIKLEIVINASVLLLQTSFMLIIEIQFVN